jgi:hypothetical protein|tara:strand:- start:743 stop:880 length:138 start_codon:yes stop_codon:yes gene_type:complete
LFHGLCGLNEQVGELDGITEALEPRLRHKHHAWRQAEWRILVARN